MFLLDDDAVRPEPLLNLLARDELARVFEQEFQQLQRLTLQAVLGPVSGEFSRLQA